MTSFLPSQLTIAIGNVVVMLSWRSGIILTLSCHGWFSQAEPRTYKYGSIAAWLVSEHPLENHDDSCRFMAQLISYSDHLISHPCGCTEVGLKPWATSLLHCIILILWGLTRDTAEWVMQIAEKRRIDRVEGKETYHHETLCVVPAKQYRECDEVGVGSRLAKYRCPCARPCVTTCKFRCFAAAWLICSDGI